MTKTETFKFTDLPLNLEELKTLAEADLSSPFKTAALTILALCRYEDSPEDAVEMLNFLKGPQALSNYDLQFLRDRLSGKGYKPYSFLEGAAPENNYKAEQPYQISIFDGPYSYKDQGYAKLLLRSSGADSPREILLREKPSSGEWFLWEQYLLSDIRAPQAEDPWA
ncbi:MAG: hypothetical protein GX034_06235 [Clostridiaceae bacterium]|jgi:hypothetical protein|nr:hypothetical protein [Clostridiaceae bacterium]